MTTASHSAAVAFNDADLEWHHALIAEYGEKQATSARYDERGRGEVGSSLRAIYDRRNSARKAWEATRVST